MMAVSMGKAQEISQMQLFFGTYEVEHGSNDSNPMRMGTSQEPQVLEESAAELNMEELLKVIKKSDDAVDMNEESEQDQPGPLVKEQLVAIEPSDQNQELELISPVKFDSVGDQIGTAWNYYLKILNLQSQNQMRFWTGIKSDPLRELPPVVLPLSVCYKSSAVGPQESHKYMIPKYAIGFVIGYNGHRVQATRDVSGATILLLGDHDPEHGLIGVMGTSGQIHDAVYLIKQNILRYSGMFIPDIDGMLKQVPL